MEGNLKELCSEALELELREKEILKEEEQLCKMQKDLPNQKPKLVAIEGEMRTLAI